MGGDRAASAQEPARRVDDLRVISAISHHIIHVLPVDWPGSRRRRNGRLWRLNARSMPAVPPLSRAATGWLVRAKTPGRMAGRIAPVIARHDLHPAPSPLQIATALSAL